MMSIIYIFYVNNFSTYSFNLNAQNNNHILIMLRIIVHFLIFIYRVSIYHVSYLIIFKINIWTYRIHVISDTDIVYVHLHYDT